MIMGRGGLFSSEMKILNRRVKYLSRSENETDLVVAFLFNAVQFLIISNSIISSVRVVTPTVNSGC